MARRKPHIWTPEEEIIIRECYPDTDTLELAGRLGVTVEQLYHKADKMKVTKSEKYAKKLEEKSSAIITERGLKSRFKPGQIAHNKGKKMSPETYAKLSANMFKKGIVPHNTKYDGCITVRVDTKAQIPYQYIRLSKGKWEQYHRVVWEQAHGTIPAGFIIRFKDGDTMNASLDNLELVCRSQHAVDNRWKVNKLPAELQETFRLRTEIKKLIGSKKNKIKRT